MKKDYREEILSLLKQRGFDKTICPSELLTLEQKQDQKMMEQVRSNAIELADEGLIEITQKGETVNPHSFRGPIRLRLRKKTKGC